jgi:hypothetical protein
LSRASELVANYHKRFLGPTPTGEKLDLPMSQRAVGIARRRSQARQ